MRSDRDSSRIRRIEYAENNLVKGDLAKKIFGYLNRRLFAGTTAVAETERRKADIVAEWLRLTVHYAEHRAEATIGHLDLSAVFDSIAV